MARTKGALGKKTITKTGQNPIKNPVKKVTSEIKVGRGRPRKDKTFVNVGVVTPETKAREYPPEIYETNIPKVEKIAHLSGKYCHMVSGKNYADAVRQAQEIMAELGYQIVNYFEQKTFGRSIIVGYNKVKAEVIKQNELLKDAFELCDIVIVEQNTNLPGFYNRNDALTLVEMINELTGKNFKVQNSATNNKIFVIA